MSSNPPSPLLEEGEIVSGDDFEDISDASISDFGKLVSPSEHLPALILSDSGDEIIASSRPPRAAARRGGPLKQRKRPRPKRRRQPPRESSSSEAEEPSPRLKDKLKEAVCIGEGALRNPLEARLKGMGGLGGKVVVEEKNEDDAELENLRMEALKTAVLNKCQIRKRKKAMEEGCPVEDKENDTPKSEVKGEEFEEDEDLLRAELLAGLAEKITSKEVVKVGKVDVKVTVLPTAKVSINKYKMNNQIKKVNNNNNNNKKVVPKPQVKPLIINVNSDSDTEEEKDQRYVAPKPAPPPPSDLKVISNNVDKFLKQQRAEVEIESKKKAVNNNKTFLEKSAVKLLPKSQQIEYQLLLKKLKYAERMNARKLALAKMRCRKAELGPPVVKVVPKVAIVEKQKNDVKSALVKLNSVEINSGLSSKSSECAEKKIANVTTELTTLQRTLKQIKMQKNGSLQIKGKYQVLTPIIRKITEASNERKRAEHRIKVLLREVDEARSNLSKAHQKFSHLVKDLVGRKEKIDRSYQERLLQRKAEALKRKLVTSTPIKQQQEVKMVDETSISTVVSSTNHECEDMDVCNSDEETEEYQIEIVDPNDIDQIFNRRKTKSTMPEYVSPLNFNGQERFKNLDPHGIMCPYEVNGSCRDADCTYKHYLKNGERL